MFSSFTTSVGRLVVIAAVGFWAANATAAPVGPFAGLGGEWNGRGLVHLSNGTKERLHCRATYKVGADGRTMHQSLRCASESYKFELTSDIESQGNQISGRWNESTHSLAGKLTGRVNGGRLNVLVQGDVLNAEVTLVSQGDRQTVTISSPGSQLSGAAISLRRS